MFQGELGPRQYGLGPKASRDGAVVIMTCDNLVEILMDAASVEAALTECLEHDAVRGHDWLGDAVQLVARRELPRGEEDLVEAAEACVRREEARRSAGRHGAVELCTSCAQMDCASAKSPASARATVRAAASASGAVAHRRGTAAAHRRGVCACVETRLRSVHETKVAAQIRGSEGAGRPEEPRRMARRAARGGALEDDGERRGERERRSEAAAAMVEAGANASHRNRQRACLGGDLAVHPS
ncbi:uncharacterized protein LOC133896522 [Phragmites australis]|uniref:uncharacterized protein LOC133896522 n=1 Tax=Phragmites australis TaxID=29695 RepID=UPI002D79E057|nr:uncharacterized protein LOC133896522 [Phragmites australis]